MKQVTAVAIGYGSRGRNYAQFATGFPDQFKVVGVAEPRKFQREQAAKTLSIAKENVFNSWDDVAKKPKFADCVVITTQDQMHRDPAVAFAKMGYHILLEKPMATTYEHCVDIVNTCKENNVILAVCHVLRYTPEAIRIRELIQSGIIGDVLNIQLLEPVGFWHYAHSYVRGNWRNSKQSTFSLLAKSCHDIDLIRYWVGQGRCLGVSSFGTLHHFSKSQKPAGAGSRCLKCAVEEKCPYSAKKIYLDQVKMGYRFFPLTIVADVPDIESIETNLRTGPYGRCVYECDNDVMENQVVIFQFEGGVTVNFSMVAFTKQVCQRQTKIFGTKGELSCDFSKHAVQHYEFLTQKTEIYNLMAEASKASATGLGGHGGADFYCMEAFVQAVATSDPSKVLTGPDESLESHRLTFAAEKARLENKVINPQDQSISL